MSWCYIHSRAVIGNVQGGGSLRVPTDWVSQANIKSSKGETTNSTKGTPIRITADLSIETLHARREWQDILKVMKEKKTTT